MCMGDNPDHLRHMLREAAARTEGVGAPEAPRAAGAVARLLAGLKTWIAASTAVSEAKR